MFRYVFIKLYFFIEKTSSRYICSYLYYIYSKRLRYFAAI